MNEVPADARRDRETMAQLIVIAENVFNRHGIQFSTAVRGGGWSNATWLAGGLALRVAVQPNTDHLRREAQLGMLLPGEVGFPASIETGVTGGFEWNLCRKIQGKNLGEVWPGLNWEQRIHAIRALWKKVESVHTVNVARAAPLVLKQSLFYPPNAAEAKAGLNRVFEQKFVTQRQVDILGKLIDRFWIAHEQTPLVLNHGDFTIENALYHEGQVVSLLDFEYALIAPPELDINELLKMAFLSPEYPDPLPDPDGQGLKQFQQVVVELSLPGLDHRGSKDVLLGYAVMLGIWALENELAHPDEHTPHNLERYQEELGSLCEPERSYLGPILALIGRISKEV